MNRFRHDMMHRWKQHNPVVKGLLITMWTILGLAFAIGVAFLFGYVVMLLWNAIVPAVFTGVHSINYLQAVGLVVLAKIFFGALGNHGGPKHKRHGNKYGHPPFGSNPFENDCGPEGWKDMHEFWETRGKKAWEEFQAEKQGSTKAE